MTDQTPTIVSKFPLGEVAMTANFEATTLDPLPYLRRHAQMDWGDIAESEKEANTRGLIAGQRILSAYELTEGQRFQIEQLGLEVPEKIYVITERDRSITTVLLSSDY